MNIGRALVLILLLLSLGAPVAHAYDVPGFTPSQTIEYKQTLNSSGGAVTLNLHVFTPPGHQVTDSRPAIVFFFGGGWVSGSPSQFHPHCEYLAARGMVAISAEYRVKNLHGTTPQECVKDGKSAIRYVRENAAALGIDPHRIAAGGGSAGGHVAAATAMLADYEEPAENLTISSKPNALVLYNPVIDNGPGGYGYSTVQAYWQTISPLYNLQNTPVVPPPTVFFLGTVDAYIPVATGQAYQAATKAKGVSCDLHLYEGQPHGFFNYEVPNDGSGPWYGYQDTLFKTDEFLVSLGYLSNPHPAPSPATGWVTISGDAGFSGGSAATASPITTDADTDAIAANFAPVTLADGDFIRLTGTVTFDAPLTASNFRIGLFDGDNPVTAGDGTGYVGIWASAPSTTATTIAFGNGTGTSNPFEAAASTTLGPIPAATTIVPANTPVAFTLMIARNGGSLDIHARFSDGATYIPSQNLLNVAVANFTYDSVAFLMTGNLDATQGSFSNIGITTGRVHPEPVVEPPPPVVPGQPVILLNDAFDSAVRVGSSGAWTGVDYNGGTPLANDWVMALNNYTGLWSSDTNAPRVATGIDGNSLAVTNTGVAYSLSTHFTPTTLAPGESISVSFNVRTSGYAVTSQLTDGSFRFGLFGSDETQLGTHANFSGSTTAGTTAAANGTVFQDDRGYAAFYDTTTTGTSTHEIRARTSAGTIAHTTNIFSPTAHTAASGGVTAANVFATDTTYPATLQITRSADGNTITTSSSFNGIDLGFTGTSALTTGFDHFAVFFGSQFGSAGTPGTPGTQYIDDVVVTYLPVIPQTVSLLRVYLLGGQSNADGRALTSGLPTDPVNLQQPQNDVDFFYKVEGGTATLTTLRPGLSETSQFGPEITLGRRLADLWSFETDTRVAIIKYANGGTNLEIHWKAGGTATTTGDGPEYVTFQQTVSQGLAALGAAYPGAALELQGMLWMQGESDAVNSYGATYQANLTNFIADVRATYGTDLPFIVGRLSTGQTSLYDTPAEATQFDLVRNAQAAVAAGLPGVSLVNTDAFGMNGDNLHFDAAGQQALGNDFAAAALFHVPFTPAPVFARLGNGEIQITVEQPTPGFRYTLQHTGTLLPGGWSDGDEETAASTTPLVLTHTPAPGETRQFFRVARSLAP